MAEAAILEKGFAATSIEELIAAVGITECGVFFRRQTEISLYRAAFPIWQCWKTAGSPSNRWHM
jgi:hypothetical protein